MMVPPPAALSSRALGPRSQPEHALRGVIGALSSATVVTQFVVLDGFVRGSSWLAEPRVFVDVATSVALLYVLLLAATTPLRRALFALVASTLLVLQVLVFRYYHVALDIQVVSSALFAKRDVRFVLLRAAPAFAMSVALVALAEWSLLTVAHRALRAASPVRGSSSALVLALASLGGLFGMGPRRATPEIRAAHALGALRARHETPVASAIALPPLHAERAEVPSILFVLTESVRAADYRGGGQQPTAPETAALTRGRADLAQMRAVSSYTALSLSAILTGRSQEGPRDEILRSPSLFDFARAARDAQGLRPLVAYFSAHSATIFETDAVRAAVDHFVSIETIRGHDVEDDDDYGDLPLDRDIVDRFVTELPGLPAASVIMLQLANTHAPYFSTPHARRSRRTTTS